MPRTISLDFGTSNTVAVSADGSAITVPVTFEDGGDGFASLPTVLSFLDRRPNGSAHPEVGPWAIRQYLESLGDVRFIQSLKSFAASRAFQGTGIFGKRFAFEDLMATFLRLAFARTAVLRLLGRHRFGPFFAGALAALLGR